MLTYLHIINYIKYQGVKNFTLVARPTTEYLPWKGHSRVGATNVWKGHSRVGATHVWKGHSCVGATHVWKGHSCVGATHVWKGHSGVGATHVWKGHSCVGATYVWKGHSHVGAIHVWELLTCETSHQSEILHSLIFRRISWIQLESVSHRLVKVFLCLSLTACLSGIMTRMPDCWSVRAQNSHKPFF